MPFRTIGIVDTEVPEAEDVGIGIDVGTIDILGNIVDVEFSKALDNTAVGGFDCIGDEGGAVNNRDVVGMEFAEDCATLRLIMAVEGGGPS
jgi:hypothetical protein